MILNCGFKRRHPRSEQLPDLFSRLGEQFSHPAPIFLSGGSALLLLGSPPNTADVDFSLTADEADPLRAAIRQIRAELDGDWEESQPAEFMPLPSGYEARPQLIVRYSSVEGYLFDPYSIAVMNIDRAFDMDMEDVRFLIHNQPVELQALQQCIEDVAHRYDKPRRLRRNFEEFKRSLNRG